MAQWQTFTIQMQLSQQPDNEGVVRAEGTAPFNTAPIVHLASVRSYKLSFGEDNHHVLTTGVAIDDTQVVGNTVEVVATLQLTDGDGHLIDAGSSSMAVDVLAYCE